MCESVLNRGDLGAIFVRSRHFKVTRFMTVLGDFIRRHRMAVGLTQAELARRVGIDSTYLGAIETGKKRPKGEALLGAIASSLSLNDENTRELALAARSSQRTLRLPDEMSLEHYETAETFIRELALLDEADTTALRSLLAAFWGVCKRHGEPLSCQCEEEETM